MRTTRVALAAGVATSALLATMALPAAGAVTPATAANGGWATTTLDEPPQAVPGGTTEIGFTILQHGRTPVSVDDVAVIVRDADGTGAGGDQEWPAVPQGDTGHYVAEVTFPDEGRYDWAVRQGWFGEHDLGLLSVGDVGAAAAAGADDGGWWDGTPWALRVLLVLPIVASAGLFLLDRSRRRRTDEADQAGETAQPDRPVVAGA